MAIVGERALSLFALLGAALGACAPTVHPGGARGQSPRVCAAPAPGAVGASSSAPAARAEPRAALEIAVTVDDLPVHGPAYRGIDRAAIADRMLAAFSKHGVPRVVGFVNGKKVDDDPTSMAILERWTAAKQPIGNHSYSHPSLNKSTLEAWIEDVQQGEAIVDKLGSGGEPRFFRFPYLHEGDTADKRDGARRWLNAHGYTIAEVTIDADDWAFNPPYARCSDSGDAAALKNLHAEIVEAHVEELRAVRELTRAIAGHEVRHVLLLHIGAADADAIDDILSAYELEGARWIDLTTALADPFYALDAGGPYPYGASLPYVIAKHRGLKRPQPIFAKNLEERLDATCR